MAELIPFSRSRAERPAEPTRAIEEYKLIDRAIAATTRLMTPHQAVRAARNLTALLAEAKEAGVTRVAVARLVEGWEDDGAPDKRLDRFTLPRGHRDGTGRAEEVPEQRRARLCRSPDRRGDYVGFRQVGEALARATSGLPGWSRERVLVRLFRGTPVDDALASLVAGRGIAAADPERCWDNLADRLADLAAWVAREAGLIEHQRLCAATRARFDLAKETITPHGGFLSAHGQLNNSFEIWEERPPVPSVLLLEERLAEAVPVRLALDRAGGADADELEGRAVVVRELRLAVGPADAMDEVRPLLEVRTRVDLALGGEAVQLRRPWLFLPMENWNEERTDDVAFTLDDVERTGEVAFPRTAPDGTTWRALLAWPGQGGSASDALQPEHAYAVWRLATPSLLAEMLGPERTAASGHRTYFPYPSGNGPTLAPENTLGAAIELALLDEAGPRLDLALLAEARRMVSLVQAYVADRRGAAAAMHRRAAARWAGAEDAP
jgi:hypothetical protein